MRPRGKCTPVRSARRGRAGRMLLRALAAGAGLVWVLWPGSGLTHVTTTNTVVFEREIAGILRRHCADCHAPGRAGAPLMSYENVWLAREDVLASVLARRMPPWAGVAGYGEFANGNALTPRERQFLVSWVEGLGPRNAGEVFLNVPDSAGETEAAASRPGGEAWELGEPALVLELPESAPRGSADGGEEGHIQRVVLDPGLAEDRGLRGVEYRPGDRESARAASFFLERTGRWLGSWTPWHAGALLPPSVAHALRAGDRIVAETSTGRTAKGPSPGDGSASISPPSPGRPHRPRSRSFSRRARAPPPAAGSRGSTRRRRSAGPSACSLSFRAGSAVSGRSRSPRGFRTAAPRSCFSPRMSRTDGPLRTSWPNPCRSRPARRFAPPPTTRTPSRPANLRVAVSAF